MTLGLHDAPDAAEKPEDFQCYGEGSQVFKWLTGHLVAPYEALWEGVVNCGKTRSICEYYRQVLILYPGTKHLWLKETRKSLTESVQATWEDWTLGPDHEVLRDNRSRAHRDAYEWYPQEAYLLVAWCPSCSAQDDAYVPTRINVNAEHWENGSYAGFRCQLCGGWMDCDYRQHDPVVLTGKIVLGGMNNPTRLFSTEYASAWWNEVQETTQEKWESLDRALRAPGTPYILKIGDCNPDRENHWANQRAMPKPDGSKAALHRIVGRFTDNPTVTREFLERMENVTGVRYRRLVIGEWVSAEGTVWENYDRHAHLITAEVREEVYDQIEDGPIGHKRWFLDVENWAEEVELTWFAGTFDWGFDAPGCFQVWGFDRESRMYRIGEVYRRKWTHEKWADVMIELYERWPMRVITCDHVPAFITHLNNRMALDTGGKVPRLAVEWSKSRDKSGEKAGIDLMRARWEVQPDGRARAYLVRDAALIKGVDQGLREDSSPWCFEEEIQSWVYPVKEDGKPWKDEPMDTGWDHACDAARGLCTWADRRDLTKDPAAYEHPESPAALERAARLRQKRSNWTNTGTGRRW